METFLIAVATLVPLLLVLVVVHELGHLVTARAMGVKALEFGVGFPPRAFGFYTGRTPVALLPKTRFFGLDGPGDLAPGQRVRVCSLEDDDGTLAAAFVELREKGRDEALKGFNAAAHGALDHEGKIREVGPGYFILADMLWSVNLTPLGGFVRLAGENNPDVPGSLAGKSQRARFLVLVAGPLMNAVLPLLVFAGLSMAPQDVVVGQVTVAEVGANTAAAEAGIMPGDAILQANGTKIENRIGLSREVNLNGGSRMELLLERDGEELLLHLQPRFDTERGLWVVGVAPELAGQRVESRSEPFWEAVPNSFVETWEVLVLVKQTLFGAMSQGVAPELSGPIGIAQVTGEITREGGFTGWLGVGILLSINLAILNLLPFPMLDGGRIVFVAIEWVRRGKRIPPEKEGLFHLIGLVILVGGILAISVNDIARLIEGRSPLG